MYQPHRITTTNTANISPKNQSTGAITFFCYHKCINTHTYMNKGIIAIVALLFSVSLIPNSANAAQTQDLIKCPDFSSVYYLAEDGKRHVFPNDKVYSSWYPDFDDVKVISCEDLSKIPIGTLVPYQAGTQLVKITSSPTVYAVEPSGELRSIESEAQARDLFGNEWAGRVHDVPDTFFPHYDIGAPLTDGEIPEGMIMVNSEGDLFKVLADGTAVEVDDVLSEEHEEMLEQYAVQLESTKERLEEIHSKILEVKSTEEDIQRLFDEIMPLLKTISVDMDMRVDDDIYFDDIMPVTSPGFAVDDDLNSDGLNDYWEEKYKQWELDKAGLDDSWHKANYDQWVADGSDEYYNKYYEVFGPEESFDQWKGEYDTNWKQFDYDPFIEEKWESHHEWSGNDNGWSDYREEWEPWKKAEKDWDEHGFDYDVPPSYFVHEAKVHDDGQLVWYWFDDNYRAESNEEAWNHCLIYGPGTGSGITWQCEALYGNAYLDPENMTENPVFADAYYTFHNGHIVSSDIEAEQYCSGYRYSDDTTTLSECKDSFGIVYDNSSAGSDDGKHHFSNGHIVSNAVEADQYCSSLDPSRDSIVLDECKNAFGFVYVDDTIISIPPPAPTTDPVDSTHSDDVPTTSDGDQTDTVPTDSTSTTDSTTASDDGATASDDSSASDDTTTSTTDTTDTSDGTTVDNSSSTTDADDSSS